MSNSLSAVHPELIAEWSEKIDILKEHLCKQRGIKLIKLPMNGNSNRTYAGGLYFNRTIKSTVLN